MFGVHLFGGPYFGQGPSQIVSVAGPAIVDGDGAAHEIVQFDGAAHMTVSGDGAFITVVTFDGASQE